MSETQNPAGEDMSSILIEQSDRLLERHMSDDVFQRAESGEWLADEWAAMQEAGLTLAMVAEEDGGIGLDGWSAARLIRLLGYHACPLPVGETMIAAAAWTAAGGELVDEAPLAIVTGLELTASRQGESYVLSGKSDDVAFAANAGNLLVEATLEGKRALFLLPAGSFDLHSRRNVAGEPRAAIDLAGVTVPADRMRLSREGGAGLRDLGAFLRAQQMIGAIERTLQSAIRHASERRQFGRALSQFQAIQHLLAEAEGHRAAAAAAGQFAAYALGDEGFDFAVAVAKARVGEAAGKVAAISHQVHGAMGFTREHGLHRYTRRLWAWRDEFGNEAFWQEKLGKAALACGGARLWPALVAQQEHALSHRGAIAP